MIVHEHVRVAGSDGSRGFFPAASARVVYSGLSHSPETSPCAVLIGPVLFCRNFLALASWIKQDCNYSVLSWYVLQLLLVIFSCCLSGFSCGREQCNSLLLKEKLLM